MTDKIIHLHDKKTEAGITELLRQAKKSGQGASQVLDRLRNLAAELNAERPENIVDFDQSCYSLIRDIVQIFEEHRDEIWTADEFTSHHQALISEQVVVSQLLRPEDEYDTVIMDKDLSDLDFDSAQGRHLKQEDNLGFGIFAMPV